MVKMMKSKNVAAKFNTLQKFIINFFSKQNFSLPKFICIKQFESLVSKFFLYFKIKERVFLYKQIHVNFRLSGFWIYFLCYIRCYVYIYDEVYINFATYLWNDIIYIFIFFNFLNLFI